MAYLPQGGIVLRGSKSLLFENMVNHIRRNRRRIKLFWKKRGQKKNNKKFFKGDGEAAREKKMSNQKICL